MNLEIGIQAISILNYDYYSDPGVVLDIVAKNDVLDSFCEKDTGALVRTKPALAPCDEDEGNLKGNQRVVYGQLRLLLIGERWPLPGAAALPANATTTAAEDDARLHEIARDLMANKSITSANTC